MDPDQVGGLREADHTATVVAPGPLEVEVQVTVHIRHIPPGREVAPLRIAEAEEVDDP